MKKLILSFLCLVLVSCSSMEDKLSPYLSGNLEELIFKRKMLNSTHLMANFHVKGANLWPGNDLFKFLDNHFKNKGFEILPKRYNDMNKTVWVMSEDAGKPSTFLNAFWFSKKDNVLVNVMVFVAYSTKEDLLKRKCLGSGGIISVSYDNDLMDLIKTRELVRYVDERQAEFMKLDSVKKFKRSKVKSSKTKKKRNSIEIIGVRRVPDSESEINAQSTKEKNSKK